MRFHTNFVRIRKLVSHVLFNKRIYNVYKTII